MLPCGPRRLEKADRRAPSRQGWLYGTGCLSFPAPASLLASIIGMPQAERFPSSWNSLLRRRRILAHESRDVPTTPFDCNSDARVQFRLPAYPANCAARRRTIFCNSGVAVHYSAEQMLSCRCQSEHGGNHCAGNSSLCCTGTSCRLDRLCDCLTWNALLQRENLIPNTTSVSTSAECDNP